jgi:hypothetical protein
MVISPTTPEKGTTDTTSNLLEYYVKDGWEPLCKFLHVDHPGVEFPRGNTTDTLNRRFEAALKLTLKAVFKRLIFVGFSAFALGYASLLLYGRGLLFWR